MFASSVSKTYIVYLHVYVSFIVYDYIGTSCGFRVMYDYNIAHVLYDDNNIYCV